MLTSSKNPDRSVIQKLCYRLLLEGTVLVCLNLGEYFEFACTWTCRCKPKHYSSTQAKTSFCLIRFWLCTWHVKFGKTWLGDVSTEGMLACLVINIHNVISFAWGCRWHTSTIRCCYGRGLVLNLSLQILSLGTCILSEILSTPCTCLVRSAGILRS